MNFGTEDLVRIIYPQLVAGQVDVRMKGGRNKFSKDLAKKIYEFLEDNMNIDMKTEARARGVPEHILAFYERACKAFGFDVMPLDSASLRKYEWILEQEAKGQKIETFAEWAKKNKAEYIRMYRKNTEHITIDWPLAFPITQGRSTEYI